MVVRRWVVVALVAVLCASCQSSSKPTSTGVTTSTSATHGTTVTDDPFVGHWHVHGGAMEIRSNMTGTLDYNVGGAVRYENDRLSFVRSPDGKRLTATIESVRFTDDKGKPIPDPHPGDSSAVGDSFSLEFVAAHLMKRTIIHSSWPASDQRDGNPYWCGNGLAESLANRCGA